MLPALVWVGVGERRRFWIPLPVFLLWPLWLVGWLIWAPMRLVRIPGYRQLGLLLTLSSRLSGLRVEVRSRDGEHIQVRLT